MRLHRAGLATLILALAAASATRAVAEPLFNDSHFHLTNYVQEGPTEARFLERGMGNYERPFDEARRRVRAWEKARME